MPEALGCSVRRHDTVHPTHGQTDDEDNPQDHRRPAEYQARERQVGPLLSGALDLGPGHVAEYDTVQD